MEMTVYFEFTDSARALIGKSAELQKMGDPPASKSKEVCEQDSALYQTFHHVTFSGPGG